MLPAITMPIFFGSAFSILYADVQLSSFALSRKFLAIFPVAKSINSGVNQGFVKLALCFVSCHSTELDKIYSPSWAARSILICKFISAFYICRTKVILNPLIKILWLLRLQKNVSTAAPVNQNARIMQFMRAAWNGLFLMELQ